MLGFLVLALMFFVNARSSFGDVPVSIGFATKSYLTNQCTTVVTKEWCYYRPPATLIQIFHQKNEEDLGIIPNTEHNCISVPRVSIEVTEL